MKNLKLQTVLPIAAFLLAGIGAYATQQTKSNESIKDTALIDGFIRHSSSTDCEEIKVDCTSEITTQLCMTEEAKPPNSAKSFTYILLSLCCLYPAFILP